MGALKSGAFPVELNGKEYGLLFSLNALDEVQEKFGGYDKLSEVFNNCLLYTSDAADEL